MSGAVSATTLATIAAGATVVSAGVGIAGALGVFGGNKKPAAPPPVTVPAQAVTTQRDDSSNNVFMGADNVKNQRVSGSNTNGGTQAKSTATADVLGGLGAGSINI